MEPRMIIGVDELTLVLSTDIAKLKNIEEWKPLAESIISEFVKLANIESIFGKQRDLESANPAGYSIGYEYGFNPFYFAIAYHPLHARMGVIVKFSAYAWNSYCSQASMNIKNFLTSIKSDLYKFRLSRIDFTVDYQNWDLSVNEIYHNLIKGIWEIRDANNKKNSSVITAHAVNNVVNTFYIGSKKAGTRLFLRVYNKKLEQLENFGYRYDDASETLSWIRFEAVFKSGYAHQLTELIGSSKEHSLLKLIANKITEKFRFYELSNERYTDFTQKLLDSSSKEFGQLKLESPRNNNLLSSIYHLIGGSGLFSTMYKCDEVWNEEASISLLEHLHELYIDTYKPNDDIKLWIKKNKGTLENENLDDLFECGLLKNKKNVCQQPSKDNEADTKNKIPT